jgi:hypothetical protein
MVMLTDEMQGPTLTERERAAYEEGQEACRAGKYFFQNPKEYVSRGDNREYFSWLAGFNAEKDGEVGAGLLPS